MKKVISAKKIMIILILISLLLLIISTDVFGSEPNLVLGENNNSEEITQDEYEDAQTPEVDNDVSNNLINNSTDNNLNSNVNNTKVYNTNNNTTDLPQTGIEDYNIGVLLIICVASAIFAYRKINDYKNI